MSPRAYINTALAIFALLLLGAGAYFVWSYKDLAGEVATADARIEAAEKAAKQAQDTVDALSAEVIRRAEFDAALRARRQDIHISLDKAANEDPVARDYLGERIPDSVRSALRR